MRRRCFVVGLNLSPTHIRVAAPLTAKGALGTMAGDEHRVVAHGPQALGDAVDQILVVALGEIGAANAASEQHIADKSALYFGRIKHHVSWGVPWAVAHLQSVRPQGNGVAVTQPARGRESAGGRETIVGRRSLEAIDPKLIPWVRPDDGQLQSLSQLGGATRVVDVRMGDPNRHQFDAQLLASVLEHIQVATRVDDGRGHALVLPDHRAVLLKGRDGDGFVVEHVWQERCLITKFRT